MTRYKRVPRNTLYKGMEEGEGEGRKKEREESGHASKMRRKRREEGGELIESEQRISGMAYSSFGSLLLFFFLPVCLSSRTIPSCTTTALPHGSSRRPSQLLVPSLVSGYQGGSVEGRQRGSGERERKKEREGSILLCLCAHTDLDHICSI